MLRERITTGYGSLWSHIKHHQTISCNSTSCDKVFPEAPGCSYSGWHAPTNPAQVNKSGCVVREERTTRTRNPLHCIIRHEWWITSYTHAQWKATVIKGVRNIWDIWIHLNNWQRREKKQMGNPAAPDAYHSMKPRKPYQSGRPSR